MWIGIDDTDSPRGMCTTYLGAVLIRRLLARGFWLVEARLIRLNPNVPWKTRGNAAISLEVTGDPDVAFELACRSIEDLADLPAEGTEPGLAVSESKPPVAFYEKALRSFCEQGEAVELLEAAGAMYRGWKGGRGLIGAAAAIASDLPDSTWELLVYRDPFLWSIPRTIDRGSFFLADAATTPDTWDTVDRENDIVVCSPHTPDPVLFGIRGASPLTVSRARSFVRTEPPGMEQMYLTNQGTDGHLEEGTIGELTEGHSYILGGTVAGRAVTGRGGHVSLDVERGGRGLRCMAYEPTKGFRDVVRALIPGDRVELCGSYKGGSLNLEKLHLAERARDLHRVSPVCPSCGKRMTSAGSAKGYKCRRCGSRAAEGMIEDRDRSIRAGWYEVPPSARRHLARPLIRGEPAQIRGGREISP
ncbi:MAG TPA: tRNA(Ile)(2)-agmatinylcytidine synthase [Methanomicrobiales archaeon]|nr:tRNA(Ile)(2)-agmatinylcytidine synthase [Methanomicrobiales archaeon]